MIIKYIVVNLHFSSAGVVKSTPGDCPLMQTTKVERKRAENKNLNADIIAISSIKLNKSKNEYKIPLE